MIELGTCYVLVHIPHGANPPTVRWAGSSIPTSLMGSKVSAFFPLPFALLHTGAWLPLLVFSDQLGSGEHLFVYKSMARYRSLVEEVKVSWAFQRGIHSHPATALCHCSPSLPRKFGEVTSLSWSQVLRGSRSMGAGTTQICGPHRDKVMSS